MTKRVCYLRRADRGGRIAGVSLHTRHTHDAWEATGSADPEHSVRTIRDAAKWIKERLTTGSDKTRVIGTLCLDTDGAVCSWVRPDEADPQLIRASVEQSAEIDQDDFDAPEVSGASERFPDLPLEVSYEPLLDSPTSAGSRTAVIASPDVPARLLIDQLDTMGIRVGSITTLWHAIALAWDPGARGAGQQDAQRIVASSAPVTACIVVDPDKCTLVWSWSQAGTLIAGGTGRLPKHTSAIITESTIARIGSDWLGWSSQLGVAPARILFVTPEPATAQEDEHAGLDLAGVGGALARAWPGASVDLVEHPDPVHETLVRLVEHEITTPLSTLTARPGRAHRSMYRWGAAALLAGATALGVGAWHFFERTADSKEQIRVIETEQMALLGGIDPALATSRMPLRDLQSMNAALRGQSAPIINATKKPIMTELDTISLVIGIPGIRVQSIVVNSFGVTVMLRVDEIEIGEQIDESLDQIGGSMLEWRAPNYVKKGDQIEATFKATWNTEASSS